MLGSTKQEFGPAVLKIPKKKLEEPYLQAAFIPRGRTDGDGYFFFWAKKNSQCRISSISLPIWHQTTTRVVILIALIIFSDLVPFPWGSGLVKVQMDSLGFMQKIFDRRTGRLTMDETP